MSRPSPRGPRTPATPPAAQGAHHPAGRPGPLTVNMPAAQADTGATTGSAGQPPDLRLPHERDQSALDTAAAEPDPKMVQAAKDLAAGQVDTDLHNQPGLDAPRRAALLRRGR